MTQMSDFAHVEARSLDEAGALATADPVGVRFLAGGTDLLGTLKDHVHAHYPQTVVNLKTIPGLDELTEDDTGLRIGTLVPIERLEHDPVVQERYPLLAEAARAVAAPQLRTMGTVGGNLCQEPRCWYYRTPENAFPCLRKGGTRCPAFTGESRYHSIYGSIAVTTRPCTAACPGSVRIPEYMERLRAGDTAGAARILLAANPMPAITGRVCPHACEGDCNRAAFDSPVSVRAVERHLGDWVLDAGAVAYGDAPPPTGRRVAVVGSGPAGLAAAFYARRSGHAVTVFERSAEAGGMLRWAIPGYRLPAEVVRRLVASYQDYGIEFVTGVEIGVDRTLDELRAEFDAVFVGPGAWGRPGLGIPGARVRSGGWTSCSAARTGDTPPVGHRVVVIGGGNVAVDVALSARRLGAERVTIVALEAACDLPAFAHELDRARDEGVEIRRFVRRHRRAHRRRRPARGTPSRGVHLRLRRRRALRAGVGRVATHRPSPPTRWCWRSARRSSWGALARGTGGRLDAGLSRRARPIGGRPRDRGHRPAGCLRRRRCGERPRVGDRGDRRRTTRGRCDRRAPGRHRLAVGDRPSVQPGRPPRDGRRPSTAALLARLPANARHATSPEEVDDAPRARSAMRTLPAGLAAAQADAEAQRCFDCGCVAATPSDLAPALVALDAVIVTTARQIPAGDFFAARVGSSTVLAPGELVTGYVCPRRAPGSRAAYEKFRLRRRSTSPSWAWPAR